MRCGLQPRFSVSIVVLRRDGSGLICAISDVFRGRLIGLERGTPGCSGNGNLRRFRLETRASATVSKVTEGELQENTNSKIIMDTPALQLGG